MAKKLTLNTWYNRLDGVAFMLVVEYPWYHPRRWRGYRFRDNDGIYRTASGNLTDVKIHPYDLKPSQVG